MNERTGIAVTGTSAVPFAKSFCETLRIPLAIPERTRINKDDKESFVVLVIIGAHHAYGNE